MDVSLLNTKEQLVVYDYYVLSLRTFPPFQVVVHMRNSYPEVFCRKVVPRSFAKIHRKTPVPESFFNPIQDGLFRGCSRMGGGKKAPTSLKSVTHMLQWWNLAQLYLTQRRSKKYMNHVTHPLEFCWHQHFFTANQQILLYQEVQI